MNRAPNSKLYVSRRSKPKQKLRRWPMPSGSKSSRSSPLPKVNAEFARSLCRKRGRHKWKLRPRRRHPWRSHRNSDIDTLPATPITRLLRSLLESPRVHIIVTIIPLRDFPTRRSPHAIVGADIIQSLLQILDPIGHTDHKRMKRETKHSAPRRAVAIKCIEVIANHPVVLFRRVAFADEDPNIVDA